MIPGDLVTIRTDGYQDRPHPLDGVEATVAAPLYDTNGVRIGWHLVGTGQGTGTYRALDCEVASPGFGVSPPPKKSPTLTKEGHMGRQEQATTETPVDLHYPNGQGKVGGVVRTNFVQADSPCVNCGSLDAIRSGACITCACCGQSGGCA